MQNQQEGATTATFSDDLAEAPGEELFQRAEALLEEKSYTDCLDVLEKIEALHGPSPRLHTIKAYAYMGVGQIKRATGEHKSFVTAAPGDAAGARRIEDYAYDNGYYEVYFSLREPHFYADVAGNDEAYRLTRAGLRAGRYFRIASLLTTLGQVLTDRTFFTALVTVIAVVTKHRVALKEAAELGETVSDEVVDEIDDILGILAQHGRVDDLEECIQLVSGRITDAARLARFRKGSEGLLTKARKNQVRLANKTSFLNRERDLLMRQASHAMQTGVPDAAVQRVRHASKFLANVNELAEISLPLANEMFGLGNVEEATDVLRFLNGHVFDEEYTTEIQNLAAQLSGTGMRKSIPKFVEEPTEVLEDGSIQHYRFSSGTCVVWFVNALPAFCMQSRVGLETLKKIGISALFVHDQRKMGGLSGFGGYAPDRNRANEAIVRILRERGYDKYVVAGISVFGTGAVVNGTLINGRGAITFGASTQLPEISNVAKGRASVVRRLRTLLPDDVLEDIRDILPRLAKSPEFLVHAHYGSEFRFDAEQAARMAGMPNVETFPEPVNKHDVFGVLIESGKLERVFRDFLHRTKILVQASCLVLLTGGMPDDWSDRSDWSDWTASCSAYADSSECAERA